jgi:hypothetical protein
VSDALLEVEREICSSFSVDPVKASVSFLGVAPIEVLRFDEGDDSTYVTLGMSRDPMSDPGLMSVATDGPRAELMLRVRGARDWPDVWRQLAVLAAAPAVEGVVYRPDMTVDLGQPIAAGSRCTGALLAESGSVSTDAGPVDLLRLLPATPNELAWCRVRGAAELIARWAEQDVDNADLARVPARLD